MVCFELTARSEKCVTYTYYPEGNKNKKPGMIELDTVTGEATLVTPAQEDFQCRASVEDLNSLRAAIDEMRKESGRAALTEDELPYADEDESWYSYASHAIQRIMEEYELGTISEGGTVMWY